jgi:Spy/CpxP family protein refolding chaperone
MKLDRLAPLLFLVALPGAAQQPPDPIAENVFPPELVRQHQEAIALTDAQKEAIRGEIKSTQGRFLDLQWSLQGEVSKLVILLKPPRPDEGKVLAQLSKVLDAERDVKKAQIVLLVRIKNILTPEQQAKLSELRRPLPPPVR